MLPFKTLHHHHHPLLLPFPLPPKPKTLTPSPSLRLPLRPPPSATLSSDEHPAGDEDLLEKYAPRDRESEPDARRRDWVDRGWAPWEEILSPEADFARQSLNEGEEVPLRSPESVEAFKMLTPAYRRRKIEESGMSEAEYVARRFGRPREVPEPLVTTWEGQSMVLSLVPPRDWPPRGWEVDEEELAFIREAHRAQSERVDVEEGARNPRRDVEGMALKKWDVFLGQYREWAAVNRDRLEEEAYEWDQDYYPGRRKRGKDYKDDMFELPFVYPGQLYSGKVTALHLYQGAFVDIGCVHDGWVPINGNDWYWIRHHIKVGMPVVVEILAKRDPFRFRFPIEMRFVDPNIDHLIFNRFEFSPIFHRDDEDKYPEDILRDARRPPIPRKRSGIKVEEESLVSNHPYVDKLWQLHVAEQMILDDEEANPDKYKDKKITEMNMDTSTDDEDEVEYTEVPYKSSMLPKMILKTNVKQLDMEAARAERQHINKLKKEAKEKGQEFKMPKLRRNMEMDEYDLMHWRRSLEEREALIRDISCRKTLGLPLEEPGRYADHSAFGKDQYDPTNPLYRYDYWGEPKNSEKSRQERMTEDHNKSIIGKGNVWYEMSYEEAIKQRMQGEARSKVMMGQQQEEPKEEGVEDGEDDDEDDLDFDYSILGSSNSSSSSSNKPVVNGTESPGMADEGMFED
ncbi:hypothetical protein QJS10_CPA06g01353 [Acorus calamus]|uniref:S1 motif domain-containing protein n=1 Tax=Acorus calamus TaxID=4465 RepID=A0AAV9ELR3_ACOCL|nr:hypothetical protein QJS10_CPA06g01353 [Acorus calamus]